MAYGYRRYRRPTMYRRRSSFKSRPTNARKPGLPIRRLPRVSFRRPLRASVAATRKTQMQLVRSVKRLQLGKYGNTQLSRQLFVHFPTPVHPGNTAAILDLCSEQPVGWCIQGIADPSPVRQIVYDPLAAPPTFGLQVVGTFTEQPFRPGAINPAYAEYNSQRFWGNTEGGTSAPAVSTKFLLKSQGYDINLQALGLQGYVELVMLSYPKGMPYPAHTTGTGGSLIDCQMPDALLGFVDTTPLSENQNVFSRAQLKQKVLKRWFFSTGDVQGRPLNAPPTEHAKAAVHQTYSKKHWTVRIKSNNVIEVTSRSNQSASYISDNIPLGSQTWLMLRTSVPHSALTAVYPGVPPIVPPPSPIPAGSGEFQRLQISVARTVSWADQIGQSVG